MSDGRSTPHPCNLINTYKSGEFRIGRPII